MLDKYLYATVFAIKINFVFMQTQKMHVCILCINQRFSNAQVCLLE